MFEACPFVLFRYNLQLTGQPPSCGKIGAGGQSDDCTKIWLEVEMFGVAGEDTAIVSNTHATTNMLHTQQMTAVCHKFGNFSMLLGGYWFSISF